MSDLLQLDDLQDRNIKQMLLTSHIDGCAWKNNSSPLQFLYFNEISYNKLMTSFLKSLDALTDLPPMVLSSLSRKMKIPNIVKSKYSQLLPYLGISKEVDGIVDCATPMKNIIHDDFISNNKGISESESTFAIYRDIYLRLLDYSKMKPPSKRSQPMSLSLVQAARSGFSGNSTSEAAVNKENILKGHVDEMEFSLFQCCVLCCLFGWSLETVVKPIQRKDCDNQEEGRTVDDSVPSESSVTYHHLTCGVCQRRVDISSCTNSSSRVFDPMTQHRSHCTWHYTFPLQDLQDTHDDDNQSVERSQHMPPHPSTASTAATARKARQLPQEVECGWIKMTRYILLNVLGGEVSASLQDMHVCM